MSDEELLSAARETAGAPPEPPPISPKSDPLLDAARETVGLQAETIRNNVVNAQAVNPVEASRQQQLARTTGLPLDTVKAEPDAAQVKAALSQIDADSLVQKYPHLAQFMTRPENAAQVHPFVPAMATTEEAVKALPVATPAAKTANVDLVSQAEKFLSQPAGAEFVKSIGGEWNRAAGVLNLAIGGVPTVYDKLASVFAGHDTTAAADWWFRNMVSPLVERQRAFELPENASFVEKAASTAGSMVGMLNQIVLTGGEAAAVPAGATTAQAVGTMMQNAAKSMAFPATTNAIDTGRKVYEATGDAHQALAAAQEEYAANVAMGVIPLSAPGGLAKRLATGFASGAAIADVQRQAANAVLPPSMQQPFDPEQIILGGLSSMMLGGVLGPRGDLSHAEAIRKTYTDATAALQSEADLRNLHYLGAVSEANPLRKNNPEAFKQFVQTMAEERNLSDVYVNAKNLDDALRQNAVEGQAFLQKSPEVAAQIEEHAALNGDVRIPLADYATYIAGKPLDEALLPHLKVSPEGMTYAEGQKYFQDATSEMKAQAEKIVAQQAVTDQQKVEQQGVYKAVLDQLDTANRFPHDVNKTYATLASAGYVARAKDAGMSIKELWDQYPLNIEGGIVGADIARAYTSDKAALQQTVREHLREMLHNPSQQMIERDIALNKLLGGENETLSARIGKAAQEGSPIAKLMARGLDTLDEGHIARALADVRKQEALKQTKPGEYTLKDGSAVTIEKSAQPPERTPAQQELADMTHPPQAGDFTLYARDSEGAVVGHLELTPTEKAGVLEPKDIKVVPEMRRQGVATALHAEAKRLGYEVQRSAFQTEEGAAFRKGLAQKEQELLKAETAKHLAELEQSDKNLFRGNAVRYVKFNMDEAKAKYLAANTDEHGVVVVDPDAAKEVIPGYSENRIKFTAAAHDASSLLADAIFNDAVKQPTPAGHNPDVVFMAGGTAAGKSTARALPSIQPILTKAQVIRDGTMSSYDSNKRRIETALAAGKNAIIAYVHRDPVDALVKGALPRAAETGRMPTIAAHAETHVGAPATILQLMKDYANDKRVSFHVIDNSGEKAKLGTVDTLAKANYNDLVKKLHEALKKEYEDGKINQTVYDAARAEGLPSEVEGDGARAGGQLEPQRAGENARPVGKPAGPAEEALVNIGLNTNEGGKITDAQAKAALAHMGVEVKESAVHTSATEPTLVARLSRPLTPEEAHQLSVELKQDAIAQHVGKAGELYGPAAEKWGPFNPDYFLTLAGKPLSEKPAGVSVQGVHFSQQARTILSGKFYGTGLKGAEAKRLAETQDSRLKSRIAFYVDEGNGITPEANVGHVRHEVALNNLYDLRANPLNLDTHDPNHLESAILNAGYDGYYLRDWRLNQGAAVVLGDAAKEIKPGKSVRMQTDYAEDMMKEVKALVRLAHTKGYETIDDFAKGNPGEFQAATAKWRDQHPLMMQVMARLDQKIQGEKVPLTEERIRELIAEEEKKTAKLQEMANKDAMLQAAPEAARAAYYPDLSTIHLLKDADLSSFTHELGHHFLELTDHLADRSPQMRGEMDKILSWFGKTPEEWRAMSLKEKTPYHEQFAESFERYLLEGHAPNLELRPVFARVRNWMMSVYKSMQGLLADRPLSEQLSPEVRQVFDRMLATEEAIKQAETVKGYEPLFKSAQEAGMGEQAYKDYLALGERATEEAINNMERKTMRDMQFLSGAKSKILRQLQRDAASKRREIRDEVTKEVESQPIEQAHKHLTEGEVKLSKGDLKAMNVSDVDIAKLKGMVSNDGIHPDMAADALGIQSGDVLVHGLLNREDPTHTIDGLTDQRMLERYGELSSPQDIERAANQAIANEARARFMATGLKVLTKSPISASALSKAAKQVAEEAVGRKKVSELRPAQYDIQEAKANRAALKAASKDPQAAVKAQREALLNNRMSRATNDAIDDVRKGLDYLKRFSKDSVRSKIDLDVRDQIDDLLARFDLRQKVTATPTRAQQSLKEWVASQEAAGYTPLVTPDMADPAVRMHYKSMTVDQFRGLHDTVKALEHIGKERQYATIAGERTSVDQYVREKLVPKILSRGVKFTPEQLMDRPEERHTNPIAIAFDHFNSWRRMAAAELLPQSHKANFYDRHEILGPFNEAITSRIMDANYAKVKMTKQLSDDFTAQAKLLGREWQDSLRNSVKNDKLVDPDTGKLMSFTRGRMIGMAIHVGNESNFHKLVAGYNFKPEDVWRFLHDNMSEKDWQATQAVWDLYEKHWPEVDAMNRRLGNTSPQKIEARPFKTNFGEQRGGYAAISYDPLRSRRGERAAAGEAINPAEGLFSRNYFRADTTTNGSLNARLENYTDRVDLDFHGIPRHMQETLHDLAYREALIDVNKIIEHPEFRKAFRSVYGREAYRSIQDWLGNLANANVMDEKIGALGRFLQYTRTGMVMNAIAFRASTVIKHGGSAAFKSAGYFAGGGEKFFARRMAAMGTNYTQEIEGARRKFGEIFARLLQQDRDFKQMSTSMFEPESLQAKGERFGHAMVAWSDMMTAVPTAWAAYDRAITVGIPESQGGTGKPMTEAQAVDYANRIVREAHGSYTEAGRSMVLNNKSEAMKMFTTLYSFMNNAYGQQLDSFDKLRTSGISSAPVLARVFMAILVPGIVAGYVKENLPHDTSAEGWAEWTGKAIADEVAASVPFVRDAVGMVEGFQGAGMVAAENWLATLVKAGKDIATGTGKPIRDFANAVGMALHIPGLGQLGSSLQYAEDVKTGKKTPQSQAELVKGVIVGH